MANKIFVAEKLRRQCKKVCRNCKESEKNFIEGLRIENYLMKCSLMKYFEVEEISPYANILLEEIDFGERTQTCFKNIGYRTLAQLLQLTLGDLASMKNFGQNSFSYVIAVLDKFFNRQNQQNFFEKLKAATEDLDGFLRTAALKRDPQIDSIIAGFGKFSDEIFLRETFYKKIQALPAEIKTKKARRLLPAGNFRDEKIFHNLPENLILADFPKWLAENRLPVNQEELLNFIAILRMDLRLCVKKIIKDSFRDEREFNIIWRRICRTTLEETGKTLNVTRERIRQIELKWLKRFLNSRFELTRIFYLMRAVADKEFVLTLEDVKKFIEPVDAEIIWFAAPKVNFPIFDKEMNEFVFQDDKAFDVSGLLKYLPEVMDEKNFNAMLEKISRENNLPVDLLRIKLLKFYKTNGKFFYRWKLTLSFKLDYILKEMFPDGYKISDESFYLRLMRNLKEIFNDETPHSKDNIYSTLGRVAILCDRGKYIHPDFVHIAPEVVAQIKNFVDSSNDTAIFYEKIFKSLKNVFAGTQITNRYFLQGVMRFYKLPYLFRKDYVTKSAEMNMGKEFENFVKERGKVYSREIMARFALVKDTNLEFLMKRCPEVIRVGEGYFIHVSQLNLLESDFEPIKDFLFKNCTKPTNSRLLFDLFSKRFKEFLRRNEIYNHEKLFSVLQYMFKKIFHFSRPYVSVEYISGISNKKVLLGILSNRNEVRIDDVISICAEKSINFIKKRYLVGSLAPDFIRVSRLVLKRPESIGLTEEIISAVEERICAAIERNGGWQSAKTFKDYKSLPRLETAWNSFLLESVLSLSEKPLCKLKTPATRDKFSPAIFVSEKFANYDLKTFVTETLIAEHKKKPFSSEKGILSWLQRQGFYNNDLPSFLKGGKALKLLKNS